MFKPSEFVAELALQIAHHLKENASMLKAHRIGAVSLDAHPWHKDIFLSILIDTDTSRKWDIGSWTHQYFADLGKSTIAMGAYEELRDLSSKDCYAPFFRCCAEALCHPLVKNALQSYTLEPDFEVFVANPDDPNEVNYCEEILGVNILTRKSKSEIINNIEEALKDPAAVRTLKHWYQGHLTEKAGEGIAQLKNLRVLYLNSMGLSSIPPSIRLLSQLNELHLDDNQVAQLDGLESLMNLELLSLRNNGLLTSEMQHTISKMTSLKKLYIGNCGLVELPDAWKELVQLEELFLFENPLRSIPDWLCKLPCHKRLGLVDVVDKKTKRILLKRYPHLEIW